MGLQSMNSFRTKSGLYVRRQKERPAKTNLNLELLEDRSLLSFTLGSLAQVGPTDPFAGCSTAGQVGTNYPNSQVEPRVAVDSLRLGAAHAKEVAKMDGNVYTKDKSGWYQYNLDARKRCISKYQFNTPAEWFAELYAAYYLEKLPQAHPDHKWLEETVHTYAGGQQE